MLHPSIQTPHSTLERKMFRRLHDRTSYHSTISTTTFDQFGTIRLQDLMNLQGRQADVIDALGNTCGVVAFTEGPPGTGKTYTVAWASIPLLFSSKLGIHLILSPSNASADDFAVTMGYTLYPRCDLQIRGKSILIANTITTCMLFICIQQDLRAA